MLDFDTWQDINEIIARARKNGFSIVTALDQEGLILSPEMRNRIHREFLDRLVRWLETNGSPYQLQFLNGTQNNMTAAGTYDGVITWLKKIKEEFE